MPEWTRHRYVVVPVDGLTPTPGEILASTDLSSYLGATTDYFWAEPNPFPEFILFPRLARLERKVRR